MAELFALRPPEVPIQSWIGGAEFSPCRTWRYRLWRHAPGAELEPYVCFVALNPSKAAEKPLPGPKGNDPTITREIDFAQSWGFRRMFKGNLFGIVSKDPKILTRVSNPIGPGNAAALDAMVRGAKLVVVAWGQTRAARERAAWFVHWARGEAIELWCFGKNEDGSPMHPLYLPKTTPLERYLGAA